MVEVYIITHGQLGEYILKTSEMIIGHSNGTKVYSLLPGVNIEKLKMEVEENIRKDIEKGKEIICIVDIIGGTPFNIIIPYLKEDSVECLAGINLPMLVEVLMNRDNSSLKELVEVGFKAGSSGVINVKELMNTYTIN